MTLNINGFEIEIKAKDDTHTRANKRDTHDAVIMFILWATEAAERYDALGLWSLAQDARNAADIMRAAVYGK